MSGPRTRRRLLVAAGTLLAGCGRSAREETPTGRPATATRTRTRTTATTSHRTTQSTATSNPTVVSGPAACSGTPATPEWKAWPTARYDAGNAGVAPTANAPNSIPVVRRWTAGGTPTGPVVSDGTRCYVSTTSAVRALSPTDGRAQWTVRIESAGVGVAVADGIVVAPTTGGAVLALDPESGERRWQAALDSTPTTPPRLTSDAVVVGTESGMVVLARDGGTRCLTVATSGPVTDLALGGRRAYAAVSSDPVGSVVSANLAAERVAFDRFLTAPPRALAVVDGRLYALTESKLAVSDAETGEFDWRRAGGGSSLVVGDPIVVASESTLAAVAPDGDAAWREWYDDGEITGVARAGEFLFVTFADAPRALAVVDAATGRTRVEHQSAAAFARPTVAQDHVLVTTPDDARAFEELAGSR
ncbi:PQQ-binding-like beta-propeller repeat protein [Salinirarus marinus]|uniref:outer membrane protein assembly factor BamB family protein n=1 Tax=Salinirarus marinus TaxID=3068310 RepID=UPI003C6C022C